MAENKQHHYVPQFYLRNFACDLSKKKISLYNIRNNRFIEEALIRTEARKPYFYGKDLHYEDILTQIEAKASKLLKLIISKNILPPEGSKDWDELLRFILISNQRTLIAANRVDEVMEGGAKKVYREEFDEIKDRVQLKHPNPGVFNLKHALTNADKFTTLGVKVLLNRTDNKFITSDNPVSPYNQFLEQREHPGGHYGILVKGIMYFFPINPELLLIIYDKKTYRIGNRKAVVITLDNNKEIVDINSIIFLHANNNVYFDGSDIGTEDIERIKDNIKGVSKSRVVINEYKDAIGPNSLLHHYMSALKLGLDHSYIKLTKNAKRYEIGNSASVPR